MSEILTSVRKLLVQGSKNASIVLVIPDLQEPFSHHKALEFLCRLRDKYNPTKIICIGDEADYHGLSDYGMDPDGLSAGDEQREMQKNLVKLWEEFPEGRSCISNHTMRPYRRAFKHGIPESMLKGYSELLKAPPGWSWHDYIMIDGVRYEHGDNISGGPQMFKSAIDGNHCSTVWGHHTKAGIVWFQKANKKPMFGMCVSCLIDERKYAFRYGRGFKDRPSLGAAVVIDGQIPIWIPLSSMF